MRRAAAAPILLLVALAWPACGPVDSPPQPPLVFNTCDRACADYPSPPNAPALTPTCSGGICVLNVDINPTLVISVPEGSLQSPGVTIATSLTDLFKSSTPRCQDPCAPLPGALVDRGSYVVQNKVAQAPGINVDLGNGGTPTTIPAQALYFPQWESENTTVSVFVDAPFAGIPLLSTRAPLIPSADFPGPAHAPGYAWNVLLGPGRYERDIVPVDDRFPPFVVMGPDESGKFPTLFLPNVDAQDDPTNPHLLKVTRADGGDLAGFAAYLRDGTTHRRLSSRATIAAGKSAAVMLNTAQLEPLFGGTHKKIEIVLEPPAGQPIPTFADPLLANALGSEKFPGLPPPVSVSGSVEAADTRPIEADLVIDSSAIATSDSTDPAQKQLHYSTSVRTAANGRYSVTLPPGVYNVFIAPTDPTAAGAQNQVLTVSVQPFPPYVAAGQTLTAAAFATLHGVATASNGRALPGARVEALPAASLAASAVTPDPRRWPRPRATTTDAEGRFTLTVDPGTLDLVVRPADGTHYPVATRADIAVSPGDTRDVSTVVPLPRSRDLILHDAAENPVAGAVIRAYVRAANAKPPPLGAPTPLIEIGSWITDADGHVQMLLANPIGGP